MSLSILNSAQYSGKTSTPFTVSIVTPGGTSEFAVAFGYKDALGPPPTVCSFDGTDAGAYLQAYSGVGRSTSAFALRKDYPNSQIDCILDNAAGSNNSGGFHILNGTFPGVADSDYDADDSTQSLSVTFSNAREGDLILALSYFNEATVANMSASGATSEMSQDNGGAVNFWSKVVTGGDATITVVTTDTAGAAGLVAVLVRDYVETYSDVVLDASASAGIGSPAANDSDVVFDQATSYAVGSPASADSDVALAASSSAGIGSPAAHDITVTLGATDSQADGSPASHVVEVYFDASASTQIYSLPDLDIDKVRITN